MIVNFQLWGQLRQAAGGTSYVVDVPDGVTATEAVQALASSCEGVRSMILDDDGSVRPVILIFREGRQLETDDTESLLTGCELTLMSPIAGG
jgi:molybdopterin converting factor small subunit